MCSAVFSMSPGSEQDGDYVYEGTYYTIIHNYIYYNTCIHTEVYIYILTLIMQISLVGSK